MPRSLLVALILVAASSNAVMASEEAALAAVRADLTSRFDEIVADGSRVPPAAVPTEKRDIVVDFYIRALAALPDDAWTDAFRAKATADTADVIRRARSHLEDPPEVLRAFYCEAKLAKVVGRLTRPAPTDEVAAAAARRLQAVRVVADALHGCLRDLEFAVPRHAIPPHVLDKAADLDLGGVPRERLVDRFLRQYLDDVVDSLRDTKVANISALKDNIFYASEVVDAFARDATVDPASASAAVMTWLATYKRAGDGATIYDLPDPKFTMLECYERVLKQSVDAGRP